MKLPDCMMPDWAEPCKGYRELYAENEELKRLLEAKPNVCSSCGNYLGLLAESECPNCDKLSQIVASLEKTEADLGCLRQTVATFLHDLEDVNESDGTARVIMSNAMWLQVVAFKKLVKTAE